MAEYYEDAVDTVLNVMRESFKGYFKTYYEGDPVVIPEINLPCCIVEKLSGSFSIDNAPTGTDDSVSNIRIKVMLNKKDDEGADPTIDLTERKLRRLCEGRDINGHYLPESVAGIFRTNITLNNKVIDIGDLQVEYDVVLRPDEVVTSEAHVILSNIYERIYVPNRM